MPVLNNKTPSSSSSRLYASNNFKPEGSKVEVTWLMDTLDSKTLKDLAKKSTSEGPSSSSNVQLDPEDPRVKKLVYSMYRDMLTNYTQDASAIAPPDDEDPLLSTHRTVSTSPNRNRSYVYCNGGNESVNTNNFGMDLRGGGSSSASAGGGPEGSDSAPVSSSGVSGGAPPPPPPPMAPPGGAIPSVRLNSEIGARGENKGPPMALAGAMSKDKKPFTYTPGGLDLSEIRSPRMAKRLQMNAAAEGVTNTPSSQAGRPTITTQTLPPAALAAMQPQMAFPVFPQGAPTSSAQLNRTLKPHDFLAENGEDGVAHVNSTPRRGGANANGVPPPPPPPSYQMPSSYNNSSPVPQAPQAPPPPPPGRQQQHPVAALMAAAMSQRPQPTHHVASPPQSPQMMAKEPEPMRTAAPPSPQIYRIPSPPPQQQHRQQQMQVPQRSGMVPRQERIAEQLQATSSPVSPPLHGVGTGSLYIPPVQQEPPPPPPPAVPSGRGPRAQTKAQAQGLGNIYIPPAASVTRAPPPPQPQGIPTPQLNKAPTPWMNSYNRMATQQAESPPYVNPGNISTPWGSLGSPPAHPIVRTIPIQVMRDQETVQQYQHQHPQMQMHHQQRPQTPTTPPTPPGGVSNRAKAAQHLGRVIPIQIQRQQSLKEEQQNILHSSQAQQQILLQQQQQQLLNQQQHKPGWPRTIPIQVEGRGGPTTMRGYGPVLYNTPAGLYSHQNVAEASQAQQQQQKGSGDMASDFNKMSMEPTQSKSMRVIQKVAENELRRMEAAMFGGSGGFALDSGGGGLGSQMWDPYYYDPMSHFTAQYPQGGVSMGNQSSEGQNIEEPRFRGGNIPSRAFKTLQTTLPPPPSDPSGQNVRGGGSGSGGEGPIMQQIPLRIASPICGESSSSPMSPIPPSEQRAPSPKKYMGSNIPSRSFKMLQAMTAPDDPDNSDSASTPTPPASSSADVDLVVVVEGANDDLGLDYDAYYYDSSNKISEEEEEYNDSIAWHYWWYYVTCYWQGYDMSRLPIPQDWDPDNPYFPPELYDPSLYQNFETEETDPQEEEASTSTRSNPFMVVEEPETSYSSSTDSDAPTLVEEGGFQSPSLLIEEYFSSSSGSESVPTTPVPPPPPPQHQNSNNFGKRYHLSTIEELTDESRGSTPNSTIGQQAEMPQLPQDDDEEEEEDSVSVSSEEDISSVSVIENKSAASQSLPSVSASSKREDETSTSDSEEEEEEDNEGGEEETAVTVRLPLKFSFGKTKSYKDVTTLLIGEEVEVEKVEEPEEEEEEVQEIEAEEEEEEEEEPVVSFTFSLSRQHSKNSSGKDATDEEQEDNGNQVDVDFWGELRTSPKAEVVVQEEDEEVKQEEEAIGEDEFDYWGGWDDKEDKKDRVTPSYEPIDDFWGAKDSSPEAPQQSKNFDYWTQLSSSTTDLDTTSGKGPTSVLKCPSFNKIGVSWDTEFNFWDKSIRPTVEMTRRFSGNFEISAAYESDSGMKSDSGTTSMRPRIKRVKKKRHSVPAGLPHRGRSSKRGQVLAASPPLLWSDYQKEKEESQKEVDTPSEGPSSSSAPPVEEEDLSAGWSYWDELDKNTTTYNEVGEMSPDIDVQVAYPQEEEPLEDVPEPIEEAIPPKKQEQDTSDSSKSSSNGSGKTVVKAHDDSSSKPSKSPTPTPISIPSPKPVEVEIDQLPETLIPLPVEKPEDPCHQVTHLGTILHHQHSNATCTCAIDDRISRAESLLWRIERFLHESLSLGSTSEGDSGVMTDLSRPISDIDTDPDDNSPLQDTSLLVLTSPPPPPIVSVSPPPPPPPVVSLPPIPGGVTMRNKSHQLSRSLREQAATNRARPRPQSLILTSTTNSEFEDGGARIRSTSAERKQSIRYQRAKTHSRLFQLLQDESIPPEDDEEFYDCSDTPPPIVPPPPPTSLQLHVETESKPAPTAEGLARRSRLLPLPLKGILTNGAGPPPPADSASSPGSGSSGVLSPTSPQTRDQLLADIIHEFHLRQTTNKETTPSSFDVTINSTSKRMSKFPSKIFKLLQDEFGEEFYQTFADCGVDEQICTAHLLQPNQELMATNPTPPATISPPSNPRRRDFRSPKSKSKSPFN